MDSNFKMFSILYSSSKSLTFQPQKFKELGLALLGNARNLLGTPKLSNATGPALALAENASTLRTSQLPFLCLPLSISSSCHFQI